MRSYDHHSMTMAVGPSCLWWPSFLLWWPSQPQEHLCLIWKSGMTIETLKHHALFGCQTVLEADAPPRGIAWLSGKWRNNFEEVHLWQTQPVLLGHHFLHMVLLHLSVWGMHVWAGGYGLKSISALGTVSIVPFAVLSWQMRPWKLVHSLVSVDFSSLVALPGFSSTWHCLRADGPIHFDMYITQEDKGSGHHLHLLIIWVILDDHLARAKMISCLCHWWSTKDNIKLYHCLQPGVLPPIFGQVLPAWQRHLLFQTCQMKMVTEPLAWPGMILPPNGTATMPSSGSWFLKRVWLPGKVKPDQIWNPMLNCQACGHDPPPALLPAQRTGIIQPVVILLGEWFNHGMVKESMMNRSFLCPTMPEPSSSSS